MAQIHQKIKKCIQSIENQINQKGQKTLTLFKFFQSLLYGKEVNYYNTINNSMMKIILYLHESHPQLLISLNFDVKVGTKRIFDIRKIQMRRQNYSYEMKYKLQRNLYLIIKDQQEEIILIFAHESDRNEFIRNVQQLSKKFQQIPNMYDPIIVKSFIKADLDQNQQISHQQLKKTINLMKMQVKNQQIGIIIKTISNSSKSSEGLGGSIILSHFQKLWNILFCRKELEKIYQKYSKNKLVTFEDYLLPLMNKKQFSQFLSLQQNQNSQNIQRIIQINFIQKQAISFYNFSRFIFGIQNQIGYRNAQGNTTKNKQKNKQNEIWKVNNNLYKNSMIHYYCYSSHNTYLTGNQLTSDSRVQRYLIDLQNGFRCVQIDVHDGDNEPIVTHGYTFTSEVTFKEVVQAIQMFSEHNKLHSPIILSLQVHCNTTNQKKMYEILTQSFGNKLVKIDKNYKINSQQQFPTFQQCLGKIIVKGPGDIQIFMRNRQNLQPQQQSNKIKKVAEIQFTFEDENDGYQFKTVLFPFVGKKLNIKSQEQDENLPYFKNKNKFNQTIMNLSQSKNNFIKSMDQFKLIKSRLMNKQKLLRDSNSQIDKIKLNPQFLSIISMLSKGKIKNLTSWQSISLNQNKIASYYKNDRKSLSQLSKKKWVRSYPDGLRVNSSNYNPIYALEMGVQILALNSQTIDCPFNLLLKVFFQKYKVQMIGYYPKINLNDNAEVKTLQIKFISAIRIYQNIQQDKIPSVQINAYFIGTQTDQQKNNNYLEKKSYTNKVQKNAFNPIFNQAQSQTIRLKYQHSQLAFLIVEIDQCGRTIIQLSQIKSGYRNIVLYDQFYKEKQSRVLCHFQFIQNIYERQLLIENLFGAR